MRIHLSLLCMLALACGDSTKKDTKTSEVKTESKTPEVKTPEVKTPEVKTPETQTTSAPISVWPPEGYKLRTEPLAPPAGAEGSATPGWIELPSLKSHKAMEAVAPQKPLLNGSFLAHQEGEAFFTDGKVEGGTTVKDCPKEKEMYLDLTSLTMSPTPKGSPLLLLCEGKDPVEGKTGMISNQ